MTTQELPPWGGWMRRLLDAVAPLSWRVEVPSDLALPGGDAWPEDHLAYCEAYAGAWLSGGAFRSSGPVGTDAVGGLVPPTSGNTDSGTGSLPTTAEQLFGEHRWAGVGVTRSADGPWGEIPPSCPWDDGPVVRAMRILNISSSAVYDHVVWGPADRVGRRALGVQSQREYEVWWFAMSVPEFAARMVTGTHGCPWLPPAKATAAVVIEDYFRERPEIDGIADSNLAGQDWQARFGDPEEPDPPQVDVLRHDLLPEARRNRKRPTAKQIAKSIASLEKVAAPPESPTVRAGWDELATAAGGTPGDELTTLLHRYGAGSFDEDAIELYDAPLCTSRTTFLRDALRQGQIEVSPALQSEDDGALNDTILVHWATVDVEEVDLIWWAQGTDSGCATLSRAPYVLEPIAGTPASVLADALTGAGVAKDWVLYDGAQPTSHVFRPLTFE